MVDLEEFEFNGQCSCEDFDYRMRPQLEEGAKPNPALRCWHLEVARHFYLSSKLKEDRGL